MGVFPTVATKSCQTRYQLVLSCRVPVGCLPPKGAWDDEKLPSPWATPPPFISMRFYCCSSTGKGGPRSGPEVQEEPRADDTNENRGIKQGEGSIAAKMNSCMRPEHVHESFGYLAILWSCVKEGHSHHCLWTHRKWCPEGVCIFNEQSPLTFLQKSPRGWAAWGQGALTHICLRNNFVSGLVCHCWHRLWTMSPTLGVNLLLIET